MLAHCGTLASGILGVLAMCSAIVGGASASAPGALVGLMAVALACCTALHGRHLTDASGHEVLCCCCCPECAGFSHAWHLRNVNLAVLVTALPSLVPSSLLAGLVFGSSQVCDFRCALHSWQSCPSCSGAVIAAHFQGLASSCCDASVPFPAVCDSRYPDLKCSQELDSELENWGGCRGVCECVGGVLTQDLCHNRVDFSAAALIGAFSVFGLVFASLCVVAVLNRLMELEGYEGKHPAGFVPRGIETAGMPLPSPNAWTAVIGRPVLGQPVTVVAATHGAVSRVRPEAV